MAWIELHQSVWDHRKTLMLAAALDIDEVYAAAHMARLWCWALDNAPGGDLGGMPDAVVARGAAWRGDAEAFCRALRSSDYVDEGSAGHLHDWEEYAGRLMERREAERRRSAARRASAKRPEDDRRSASGRPAVGQQTTVGTVPNQTEGDPFASLRDTPAAEPAVVAVLPAPRPPVEVLPAPADDPEAAIPHVPVAEIPAVAKRAYDAARAVGWQFEDSGWVGRCIGRMKRLTPTARADVPAAVEWAAMPGHQGFVGTWLTSCSLPEILTAWRNRDGAQQARASPSEPAAFAGIRGMLARAHAAGGDGS